MSLTTEPETEHHARTAGGINLVARARPYFGLIVLTTSLLTAFGIVAMLRMPSGIYPEVAFPRIVVIAQTPGLGVKDVEVAVTRPIEEVVGIVLGVVRVRSKSVRGAAELIDRLRPRHRHDSGLERRPRPHGRGRRPAPRGDDHDHRAADPVGLSRSSRSSSPAAATRRRSTTTPITICGPGSAAFPDVSYVTVQGGDIREILIEVDPQALVAANLSIADVADRLAKEHRLKAVGRLDRGTLQYQVLADTLAIDPLDLEDRVIVEKNGQSIRLRDLGRVDDRARRSDDGDPVQRQGRRRPDRVPPPGGQRPGRLALPSRACWPTPPRVPRRESRSIPSTIRGSWSRRRSPTCRDAIVIGGLMSVAVLLLFLKSLRATLIAALSIPLSLIITFVFLYLTGDTLNLMSLGGLAVAIGLIIDDTVVVIENIARHLAGGESGDGAIDRASREISGAVIGSTLTTILVFVPLAFVSGVVGQFFQSLSLSLSVALLVSMVVSLTIIPVLAARFLGRRPMPTTGPVYNLVADRYEGLLKVGLKFPITAMLAGDLVAAFRSGGWPRTWRPGSCPTWTRGPSCSTTRCPWAPRWSRPTRSCAGSRRCSRARPTSPATSAGPAPSSGSSPPSRTRATFS